MSTPQQPHHSTSGGTGDSSVASGESVPLRRPKFNIFSRGEGEPLASSPIQSAIPVSSISQNQPAAPAPAPVAPAMVSASAPPVYAPAATQPERPPVAAPVSISAVTTPTAPQPERPPVAAPVSVSAVTTQVATQTERPPVATPVLAPQSAPQPPPLHATPPQSSSKEPEPLSRVTVSRTESRPPDFQSPAGIGKQRSNVPWEAIPDYLPFGVVILDSQQNVTYCNSVHKALLGVSVEDAGGIEPWLQKMCPNAEYSARVIDSWREHIWRKQLTRTFSLKGTDQKLREIEFSATLMEDGGLLLTQMDVTEARRNESQLRMGEKKFRTVFQNDPGGLVLVDPKGGILDANPVFESLVGYTVHQLRKMMLVECLVPQDGLRLRAAEEKLAHRPQGPIDRDTIEVRLKRENESPTDLPATKLTLCPIRDDEGRIRLGLYFVDLAFPSQPEPQNVPVTVPKVESTSENESEKLRQSREENMAMLHVVPDMIFLLDRELRIVDVAPPTGEWSGKKPLPSWSDESIKSAWPSMGKAVETHSAKVFAGNVVSEVEFESERGFFKMAMAPCGRDRMLIVVNDSTELRDLRNETRWRNAAVRQIEDSILVTDLRGTIFDINPAAETEFGYKKVDLIGRGISKLYSRDEAGANAFNSKLSKALNRSGHWEGRCEFYRKDGGRGVAELKFSPVMENGRPKELLVIHREVKKTEHHAIPAPQNAVHNLEHEQMQHRFRNQLQMVTSLFALEGDGLDETDKQDAGSRWQVRLRAMAQSHAHQHPQDGTVWVVPLIRSISDEVAAVTGRGPGRREVIVHGSDSFRVDVEMATAFSLLVGEIIRLALKRPVRSDGPELFLQLKKKSGSELSLVATAGAGGALFPEAKDSALSSMKNLVQQLRGRMQMTQNGGTQALNIIISSGVKLGDES